MSKIQGSAWTPITAQPRTSYSGRFLRRQGLLSSPPQVSTSLWRVTSLCFGTLAEIPLLGDAFLGSNRLWQSKPSPEPSPPGPTRQPATSSYSRYPAGTPHKTQAQGNCALSGASNRLILLLPLVVSGIFSMSPDISKVLPGFLEDGGMKKSQSKRPQVNLSLALPRGDGLSSLREKSLWKSV